MHVMYVCKLKEYICKPKFESPSKRQGHNIMYSCRAQLIFILVVQIPKQIWK